MATLNELVESYRGNRDVISVLHIFKQADPEWVWYAALADIAKFNESIDEDRLDLTPKIIYPRGRI